MNEENPIKKDYKYVWIALFFSLFFWVPVLNVIIFLPIAILFSTKQIKLVLREPEIYGNLIFPVLILAHSTFSIIVSAFILYLSTSGKL